MPYWSMRISRGKASPALPAAGKSAACRSGSVHHRELIWGVIELVNQVPEERCQWLVPGLLRERYAGTFDRLPEFDALEPVARDVVQERMKPGEG